MAQLRETYNGIKTDFRTTQKNTQNRLQLQQAINQKHFKDSMKILQDQFNETQRQKQIQQIMLKKHYKHQK